MLYAGQNPQQDCDLRSSGSPSNAKSGEPSLWMDRDRASTNYEGRFYRDFRISSRMAKLSSGEGWLNEKIVECTGTSGNLRRHKKQKNTWQGRGPCPASIPLKNHFRSRSSTMVSMSNTDRMRRKASLATIVRLTKP